MSKLHEVGEATHKAAGGLKVPAEFRIKSREDPSQKGLGFGALGVRGVGFRV